MPHQQDPIWWRAPQGPSNVHQQPEQPAPVRGLLEQSYPGITELLNNPENWKEAAIPRKQIPILPGEFMQAPSKMMARIGLPTEFGPYARAADDISEAARRSFSNSINAVGNTIDPALDALRKYLGK